VKRGGPTAPSAAAEKPFTGFFFFLSRLMQRNTLNVGCSRLGPERIVPSHYLLGIMSFFVVFFSKPERLAGETMRSVSGTES